MFWEHNNSKPKELHGERDEERQKKRKEIEEKEEDRNFVSFLLFIVLNFIEILYE